jgi:hypothetical protein
MMRSSRRVGVLVVLAAGAAAAITGVGLVDSTPIRATGTGSTTVAFGLTRGETAKAYESRRFTVQVR